MGRVIPFCAARSTGPSHNIGINIQQMMSSMKFQRRVKRRYPVLTYNLGSSIVTYNGAPLSTLESAVNARARHIKRQRKRHHHIGFKLPKNSAAIDHMNKEIIQQNTREPPLDLPVEKQFEPHFNGNVQLLYQSVQQVHPDTAMNQDSDHQLNGSSSEVENVDSGVNLSRCKKRICIPKSNLELLFVSEEFENFARMSTSEVSISQFMKRQYNEVDKSNEKRLRHTNFQGDLENSCQQMQGDNLFQGKEKKLKEVLIQLHDDFEELNRVHADLSNKMENVEILAGGDNVEISKRLGDVEKELTKKEDQIVMIMTLCNEVITLRQRLKYMDCIQHKYIERIKQNQHQSSTQSSSSSFNKHYRYNR